MIASTYYGISKKFDKFSVPFTGYESVRPLFCDAYKNMLIYTNVRSHTCSIVHVH